MNWTALIKLLFRNTIIITVLGVIILGALGLLLAGTDGLVNGATWGLVCGVVSLPFNGIVIASKYWGDFAGRYGDWWIKKETEGDENAPRRV
jgi:hypothetical protein